MVNPFGVIPEKRIRKPHVQPASIDRMNYTVHIVTYTYYLSIKGLGQLQVTINKIFRPEMWKELWSQYMLLNPEFQITGIQVSWRWC